MAGFRGNEVICGVNKVLAPLHFEMCKYISSPHTCSVTIKRRRISWRGIQTGSLPTEPKARASTPKTNLVIFVQAFTLRWGFSERGPQMGSIGITGMG